MKRTDRITLMEERYEHSLKTLEALDKALEDFDEAESSIRKLISYYESGLWMKDFDADAKGKLPADLKRGVLSEDGLYDLLSDYQRLKDRLK